MATRRCRRTRHSAAARSTASCSNLSSVARRGRRTRSSGSRRARSCQLATPVRSDRDLVRRRRRRAAADSATVGDDRSDRRARRKCSASMRPVDVHRGLPQVLGRRGRLDRVRLRPRSSRICQAREAKPRVSTCRRLCDGRHRHAADLRQLAADAEGRRDAVRARRPEKAELGVRPRLSRASTRS